MISYGIMVHNVTFPVYFHNSSLLSSVMLECMKMFLVLKIIIYFQTRVLVTNALHFLPRTNHIYVLENGRTSESGTYDELLERDQAFAQFLRTYLLDKTKEEKGDREDNADEEEDKSMYSLY